jgi:hypothetical protein
LNPNNLRRDTDDSEENYDEDGSEELPQPQINVKNVDGQINIKTGRDEQEDGGVDIIEE